VEVRTRQALTLSLFAAESGRRDDDPPGKN
jgi:hypothetical protein